MDGMMLAMVRRALVTGEWAARTLQTRFFPTMRW
jgi:hypothetical protein